MEPTFALPSIVDGAPPAARGVNEEDATLPDRPLTASIPAPAPADAATTAVVLLDAPSSPAAPLLTATPAMAAAAAMAVAVKREPGTGESGHNPNQNQQAQFDQIKQEMAVAAHIMNQSAPATASSSPKLLPSIAFPPFTPPTPAASPSPPPPLSALAPSLFPAPSSSPSAPAGSSSPLPSPSSFTPMAPTPSVPLTSPSSSSWEQQTLARLNSLTQMTSQIASIALEKTAAKHETVVTEADKPDSVVEWVTSISRSLQTELQSVYLTLHGGPTEPSASIAVPLVAVATTTPTPVPAPTTLPTAILAPSPSSPSPSPLSLSPSIPSFSPNLLPAETPHTSALTAATPPQLTADDQNDSKKARRRRKTKTKDSFNHMQRKCASCQRTETTKWRHGPLGSNTLCNTCGLAYSRKKKREAEQAAKLNAAGGGTTTTTTTTTTPSAAAASTPSP